MIRRPYLPLVAAALVCAGCGDHHHGDGHGHDHGPAPAPTAAALEPATNRIPIPAAVRTNLGITFAKAEYRDVAATRRFPGRFEPDADARHAYAAPFAGQVELLVRPYERVEAGRPLYRLAGRGWAELQREWREAHAESTPIAADSASQRRTLVRRALAQAAGLGIDHPDLAALAEAPVLTVHARAGGVIEGAIAATGTLAAAGDAVLATTDPARVRLRATALQGDLVRLRPEAPCRIVPLTDGSAERIPATMTIALEADPQRRTQDLIAWPAPAAAQPWPSWARAGLTALLEVEVAGGEEELAIPVAATIRDGLATILFRRDPADPDRVIRLEGDLGASDGRWVQVLSGLREGDEVVVDGIYQLKLSGAGKAQLGGHFHADGTFHADDQGGH